MMLPPLSPLLKRLVVGLTSSLLVAVALGIGFRLTSTGYFALRMSQVGINTTRMPLPVHSQNKADNWPPEIKHVSPNHVPLDKQDETELIPDLALQKPATVHSSPSGMEGVDSQEDAAMFVALDRFEERIAAGMIRARESVVALEYTSAVGPAGSRRVATGVVINSRGDILSVRIDQPSKPASSTHDIAQAEPLIVARDALGRRYVASWLAMDPETGLTLLRIAPQAVRPIQIADSQPRLGSQVFVVGNPLGLGPFR